MPQGPFTRSPAALTPVLWVPQRWGHRHSVSDHTDRPLAARLPADPRLTPSAEPQRLLTAAHWDAAACALPGAGSTDLSPYLTQKPGIKQATSPVVPGLNLAPPTFRMEKLQRDRCKKVQNARWRQARKDGWLAETHLARKRLGAHVSISTDNRR